MLNQLKKDLQISQKKGLPFMLTGIVIWTLITICQFIPFSSIYVTNIATLSCSSFLFPLTLIFGKLLHVNITDKSNPLTKLGMTMTFNQSIYLLIVIWAFNGAPQGILTIYAIIFAAHLFPYGWLYDSKTYYIGSVILAFLTLILSILLPNQLLSLCLLFFQILFVIMLVIEIKSTNK